MLSECQFIRCTITGLKTTMSRAKFTEFQSCTLNNIEWMSLQGDGSFADPIEKLQGCRLKYNTFTEMNVTKFNFARQRDPALDVRQVQSRQCRF